MSIINYYRKEVQVDLLRCIKFNLNCRRIFKGVSLSTFILLTTSCSQYAVMVNQQTVYTPPTLFVGYILDDKHLKACVQSNIAEKNITSADQLMILKCPDSDIKTLTGLSVFHKLKTLDLQNNHIKNVDVISHLKNLENLNISHNSIQKLKPLNMLEKLIFLDATNNPLIDCDFKNNVQQTGILPDICLEPNNLP